MCKNAFSKGVKTLKALLGLSKSRYSAKRGYYAFPKCPFTQKLKGVITLSKRRPNKKKTITRKNMGAY